MRVIMTIVLASGCATAPPRDIAACTAGTAASCVRAAASESDLGPALTLLRRGCELGDPDGCVGLAAAQLLGLGVAQDVPAANERLNQLCGEKGIAYACYAVAGYLTHDWLVRSVRARGQPQAIVMTLPEFGRLGPLGQLDPLPAEVKSVIGFCLGEAGGVASVNVLRSAGHKQLDGLFLATVGEWQFGPQRAILNRCWSVEINMRIEGQPRR